MPVDSNIFQQYLAAPKSVADYSADMDKAESNKLTLAASRMAGQQAQQGMADDQAVRQAYQQSGGDQNKLLQILQNNGQYKAGQALQKTLLDSQKLKDDSAKTQAETLDKSLGTFRSYVPQVTTPEAAGQYAAAMYDHPLIGSFAKNFGTRDEAIQRNVQAFSKDPRGWMAGSAGITADKLMEMQKGTRQNVNVGNASMGQTANYYGEVMPGQTTMTPIGQDANSLASNATSQRGEDMKAATAAAKLAQDDRQFAQTAAAKRAEGKPLTESQGNATNFAARMTQSTAILDKLELKTDSSKLGTIAASRAWTNWAASDEGQQYEQAARNWVTANLRKESGAAIPDSEMANEVKKYFPQINDSDAVKEQKRQARAVSVGGMMVQAGHGADQVAGIVERGNAPKPSAKPDAAGMEAEMRKRGLLK